jgi:6-pyruvoyltetrahydropterin/6-carboxytetrahydropterin synthase
MTEITRTLQVERSTSTAHRLAHYEGVCANVHGHNMKWDIHLTVDMSNAGEDNMPLDFKEVSDLIDETDHAILLNENDGIVGTFIDMGLSEEEAKKTIEEEFGDVIWFDGDPTCELVSQWMADRLVDEIDAVMESTVELAETEKYSIVTNSIGSESTLDHPLGDF